MSTATLENKKKILQLKQEKLKRTHPKLWIAKYHHLNVHNKRMEFGDRYRFLVPIYKALENYAGICCEKAVQCCISEMFIISALEEASSGLRILYVMPNIDLRGKFVKDRLDRLLVTVPLYREYVRNALGSSISIGLKHFGKGIINFVGSNSAGEFISFPADAVYEDEVDKCDQKNLEMAPDRLDHSDYKFMRRCGNPSIEKWGIDAIYRESTQGVWKIECEVCRKSQEMDFFKNVVRQTGDLEYEIISGERNNPKVVCIKCGRELNRLSKGKWVHKFNKREIKGYRISQLFSSNVTIVSLVDKFFKGIGNEIKTQLFYNSNLGLPYSSSGSKVTYSVLEDTSKRANYSLTLNDTKLLKSARRLYFGIDVGKYFHVIGRDLLNTDLRKLVFIGRFSTVKEMEDVFKNMKSTGIRVKKIVIDKRPEIHKVEELKKTFGKMYSCDYREGKTLLDIRKAAEQYKKEREVFIDRTLVLDTIKSDFVNGLMINPLNASDIGNEEQEEYGEYYQHMLSSTRVFNETRGKFEWRESGPDHFLHAEAYCRMAQDLDDRILDFYEARASTFA